MCVWNKIHIEASFFIWHTKTKEITIQMIKISFLFLPETISKSIKFQHTINNACQTQLSNIHLAQLCEQRAQQWLEVAYFIKY
jgi:hypothetical protein